MIDFHFKNLVRKIRSSINNKKAQQFILLRSSEANSSYIYM